MPQPLQLNGTELEKWFKSIAQKAGILDTQGFQLEEVVRLFNREIPDRFKLARENIDLEYPYGNQWIDKILEGRSLQISEKIKVEFSDKLLDLSLATDAVIKGKTVSGQEIRIAVDVTWNKSIKAEKIQKIRGNSKPKKSGIELNKNIPSVRKKLGLEKHIVLLMENQTDKLPSAAKLISEINSFSEEKSLTKIINLRNLPTNECFNWETYACDPKKLWDECSPGIKERTAIETSVKVAAKAMRRGHSLETVAQMMVHDPEYKRLLKANQGDITQPDVYAKFISQKASELINRDLASPKNQHDLNLRGLKAARAIISTATEGVDGKQILATDDYRLTQQGTAFSVDDKQGQRGTILEFSQGFLEGAIIGADIRKLESLSQSLHKKTDMPQTQASNALYTKFALGIQKAQGILTPYRLDLEIQFHAKRGKVKDIDQLLMHSEVTKTLSQDDPIKAQRYIKAIGELGTLYESLRESPNQEAVNRSIQPLVQKKLADPVAIRRLREETIRKQERGQERQL